VRLLATLGRNALPISGTVVVVVGYWLWFMIDRHLVGAWVAAMVGPGKIPTERQLFAALGVEGIQDIGTDEIIIMQGWQTSIRDGVLTYAEIVAPPEPDAGKASTTTTPPANGTKSAKLAAKLADSSPPEPGSNG
jgi:hypothetical protein